MIDTTHATPADQAEATVETVHTMLLIHGEQKVPATELGAEKPAGREINLRARKEQERV